LLNSFKIHYWLNGTGIESLWGASVSAYVQKGPGFQPACCAMSTGLLPGGKMAGAWSSQLPTL